MNFRQLQTLQEAAPILLRHLGAYAELAGEDIAAAKGKIAARMQAGIALLISAFFTLLMLCLFVVAATWDTQNRLLAIGAMGGFFLVTVIIAATALARNPAPVAFASVRREWRQDRLILDRLLGEKTTINPEH